MLVGEIGIPRQEFLYELTLAEIILITRGYFKRYHPGWEQARMVAYHAAHCMGSKTPPPPITQWVQFPWEKEKPDIPDEEEVAKIRKSLQRLNARKKKKKEG